MAGIKVIAENRKARFDYELIDKFEAGMVLQGSEVKSLRDGQCTLKDSYVAFIKGEAFLQNAHISVYKASSYNNHDPERLRKLLMHEHELKRLEAQINEKGYSLIPTKIYFKKGKVKLEVALAKGKSKGDKRDSTKKRDADRAIASQLRHSK